MDPGESVKLKTKETCGWFLVLAGVAGYTILLARLALAKQMMFRTSAFDLSIFDQSVWLISHGLTPFCTVRGVHILADHFTPILYLAAPLFWIWDDVRMLLLVQTLVLAAGALFVYSLARRALGSVALAACFAFCYLAYPALSYANRDDFHPITLAATFLLGALYALEIRKAVPMLVMLVLALACGEQIAICTLVLGLCAVATRSQRRQGVLIVAVSLFWFAMTAKVVPAFHGRGNVNWYLITYYGYHSFSEFAWSLSTHPWRTLETLTSPVARAYTMQLLLPALFLPAISPLSLLPAVPLWAANLLSNKPIMHVITFHYAAPLIPFIWNATVRGAARLARLARRDRQWMRAGPQGAKAERTALAGLGSLLVLTQVVLWSLALAPRTDPSATPDSSPHHLAVLERAIRLVPKDASVSAQQLIVPHLAHRKEIYLFPNPFQKYLWGYRTDEFYATQPMTAEEFSAILQKHRIDFILLDVKEHRVPPEWQLQALNRSRDYQLVLSDDGVQVYERVRTP